ncbi:MAG: dihydropteroate synthase [Gammaproteobacteria bacterium]|nr:dihydropteroate synthase [Gammaproteobacteria bacterium]MDH5652218.1 dihydropteroate synthase [Gammaproteobacteria bacterium]
MKFSTPTRTFTLPEPCVMGILNVTPDSFSDGGKFNSINSALIQVRQMILAGASMIDIGGESTRPGAAAVEPDEELARVIPVIEAIRQESDIPISIDTSKADVMRAAVQAGADMINDVCALRGENALATAAAMRVPVCLMHMQGEPRTMQTNPVYEDVVVDVSRFLQQRMAACIEAGIDPQQIIIDPGFGFGKTPTQNMSLIKHLSEFAEMNVPILMGVSRKSTIGYILNKDVGERVYGSVALAMLAMEKGASIIRAHDVAATMDAVKLHLAVRSAP